MKYRLFALLLLPSLCLADSSAPLCQQATTTVDMQQCTAAGIKREEAIMQRYLQAAFNQHHDNALLQKTLHNSQLAWHHYQQAHCRSVAAQWQGGSIAPVVELTCRKTFIQQRTHQLWQDYLVAGDGTSSVLSEPALTNK